MNSILPNSSDFSTINCNGTVTLTLSSLNDNPTLPFISRLNHLPIFSHRCHSNYPKTDRDEDADSPVALQDNYFCKYYETDNVCAINNTSSNFGIIHFNCQSIKNKMDDFLILLEQIGYKFTVICLTETWFQNEVEASEFAIDGYCMYSSYRSSQRGGGVSILVDNSFVSKLVPSPLTPAFECCSVDVLFSHVKVQINCIYNSSRKFSDEQASLIESLLFHNPQDFSIFCGDWNLNLLKYPVDPNVVRYVNTFSVFGYKHVIDRCTRIHTTSPLSGSLIDHILVSPNKYFVTSGILVSDFSDHYPIFAIFDNLSSAFKVKSNKIIRDFRHFSSNTFINLLSQENWSAMNLTPDDFLAEIKTNIISSLDSLAPFKVLSKKETKRKPWITADIVQRAKTKRTLYKKYLNSGKLKDRQLYREFSNKLGKLILNKKKDYFTRKLTGAGSNMKMVWNAIKDILNYSRSFSGPKTLVTTDGVETSDNYVMANTINKFFTDIGADLASHFPITTEFESYLGPPCQQSCFFMPTDAPEVYSIIGSLNEKTSAGYDGISAKVLKIASPVVSAPLAELFNHCFSTGFYPNELKIAKVVPIFKKGDPTDPGNYRPISVLPLINKIFEKIIFARLNSFFTSKNILHQNQFGFRKAHSTMHALMEMTDDLQSSLDKGQFSCSIYIDLKKAFDTVDHKILLSKLSHYGVRGNFHKLLSSYLSNRQQYAVVNGVSSELLKTQCGVPQGSVLGPLFFNVYVNDIVMSSQIAKIILFADDTNIRYVSTSYATLQGIVNEDLGRIFEWFSANKLTVSLEKTKYMIFAPPRAPYCNLFSVILNDIVLTRVNSVKHLGVYIDDKLKWSEHINYVANKINKNAAVLWRTRYFLSFQHRKMLYNSLVFPHLHYCCSVWGAGPPSNLHSLLAVQNRCLKIINFSSYLDSPLPLYLLYNTLDIYKMVYFSICLLMHAIKTNRAPPSIVSKFSRIHDSHSHYTRLSHFGFSTKRFATNKGKYSISSLGPKFFNKLPSYIADSIPVRTFKCLLKSHLLNTERSEIINLLK